MVIQMSIKAFFHNLKQLLIAIDQVLNVLIFIFSKKGAWADETMSAHAFRLEMERGITWPRRLIDTLLFFDKDHCQESYLSEVERRQLPPSMRKADDTENKN